MLLARKSTCSLSEGAGLSYSMKASKHPEREPGESCIILMSQLQKTHHITSAILFSHSSSRACPDSREGNIGPISLEITVYVHEGRVGCNTPVQPLVGKYKHP